MIEPELSLALSIQSAKGAYALLLGSGTSRSAGIPTGWEVLVDLIRKLAQAAHQDCGADPVAWYRQRYKKEPRYGTLLGEIAHTPLERSQLLRGYFEPTEEERRRNQKIPMPGHRAIANLIRAGYIRVILTTNFDRLIESALSEVGIVPTVISSPDAAEGAVPLIHSGCTIIKLHGDYVDSRIRNVPQELLHYDRRMNKLLD